ncbi:MAG: hypothetical protein JWN44_4897 [Myxococcales bacterium]|nr:hypothetical protein [Myxococcales bacterium]
MNRMMTALALSGLFLAAPAFAKTSHHGRQPVASAGDKAAGSEKTTVGDKAGSTETKTETKTEAPADGAKPMKKAKKSKKVEKTETTSEKPAEAPAK